MAVSMAGLIGRRVVFRVPQHLHLANVARRFSNDGRASNGVSFSPEVKAAMHSGGGIVALESTIVAHGMPFPQNLQTATEVESIVRKYGATPATIAIIKGDIKVGLSDDEMNILAEHGSTTFKKASRRDLSCVLGLGVSAATTVSSTSMIASDLAGIDIFVTGGIGGVHRGVEATMDISADLTEMGRTPTVVVCAGAKSILDIPRTLEVLETQGVPVLGFRTDEFPSFFSRTSGHKVTQRVDSITEIVEIILAHKRLGSRSGIVVAVPIPDEDAASGEEIESAIQQALNEASNQGVAGKSITPFILKRVNELTHGASLAANIKLVHNNAKVGAQIAAQLAEALKASHKAKPVKMAKENGLPKTTTTPPKTTTTTTTTTTTNPSAQTTSQSQTFGAVVIGGIALDSIASPLPEGDDFAVGTSNIGVVEQNVGGVAKNITESYNRASSVDAPALLVSAVGDDTTGVAVLHGCDTLSINTHGIITLATARSATYTALHNQAGELLYGVADMGVFDKLDFETIEQRYGETIRNAKLVVCDANLSLRCLKSLSVFCSSNAIPLWYEPTSNAKCTKAIDAGILSTLQYCKPNITELILMSQRITGVNKGIASANDISGVDCVNDIAAMLKPHLDAIANAGVEHCLISVGAHGIIQGGWATPTPKIWGAVKLADHEIVNSNGAGDTFVGVAAAAIVKGFDLEEAIQRGVLAASLTMKSRFSVSQDFTHHILN